MDPGSEPASAQSPKRLRRPRSNSEGSPRRTAKLAPETAFTPHLVKTDATGVVSFVNSDFLRFTGFSSSEFVGKKCDFLQGENTDPEDIEQLSKSVKSLRPASVVILNYTKAGVPFWNILRIRPERDGDSSIFVGDIISLPVPDRLRDSPQLCFDDALALMRVFSNVPRTITDPSRRMSKSQRSHKQPCSSDRESHAALCPLLFAEMVENGPEIGDKIDSAAASSSSAAEATTAGNITDADTYCHVDYAKRFPDSSTVVNYRTSVNGATKASKSESASSSSASSTQSARQPLQFIAETSLPTDKGRYRVRAYRDPMTGAEPLAMVVGDVEGGSEIPCRVHDQCVTSEVFGSLRCDCKQQLNYALKYMQGTR